MAPAGLARKKMGPELELRRQHTQPKSCPAFARRDSARFPERVSRLFPVSSMSDPYMAIAPISIMLRVNVSSSGLANDLRTTTTKDSDINASLRLSFYVRTRLIQLRSYYAGPQKHSLKECSRGSTIWPLKISWQVGQRPYFIRSKFLEYFGVSIFAEATTFPIRRSPFHTANFSSRFIPRSYKTKAQTSDTCLAVAT